MNNREREHVDREVRRTVEQSEFELFDLRIGQDRSIHVVIDKPVGRVSVDEMARFNGRLRRELAAANVDVDAYSISVQSPGADRPLREPRHFERFRGERVRVVRRGDSPQQRVLVGTLIGSDERGIRLLPEGAADAVDLRWPDIGEARLDPKLPF